MKSLCLLPPSSRAADSTSLPQFAESEVGLGSPTCQDSFVRIKGGKTWSVLSPALKGTLWAWRCHSRDPSCQCLICSKPSIKNHGVKLMPQQGHLKTPVPSHLHVASVGDTGGSLPQTKVEQILASWTFFCDNMKNQASCSSECLWGNVVSSPVPQSQTCVS